LALRRSAPGKMFLDPQKALFMLHAPGFYAPEDWDLELRRDPHK